MVFFAAGLLAFGLPDHGNAASGSAKRREQLEAEDLPTSGPNLARPNGGWINAQMVGTRLILRFFDGDKRPLEPNVARGFALFRYSSKNPERATLHREGDTLASTATVRPPHNFLVLLRLFNESSEQPIESYSFRYP